MPINYKKYPPNWKELRAAVMERAKCKCEFCGLEHMSEVKSFTFDGKKYWFKRWWSLTEALFIFDRSRYGGDIKTVKVVLTVAHLDHDETNHNVTIDRLRALCQRCHLRYDQAEKIRRRQEKFA